MDKEETSSVYFLSDGDLEM